MRTKIESKKAFGFGKIIIFGEHLVVHGLPALVASLDLQTHAEITETTQADFTIVDNRPKAPGFVPSKRVEYQQMLENILSAFEIRRRNFSVILSGSLPVTCGGIGSSAATAVAFARAVSDKLNLNLNNEQINQAALVGERSVHGTPSGIDNTAAVYGGVIKFCKSSYASGVSNTFSKIQIKRPIEIVIIDSGKQTDTKSVVASVSEFIQKNPKLSKNIFDQYQDIFNFGVIALESGDSQALGLCMNQNHVLLQRLGVSCPELDSIVNVAIAQGALGAKLTGTGRGGLVIALTPGQALQTYIANFFALQGFFVIKTKINA